MVLHIYLIIFTYNSIFKNLMQNLIAMIEKKNQLLDEF